MDHKGGTVRVGGEAHKIEALDRCSHLLSNQRHKIGESSLVDSVVSAPALDDADERARTADQHDTTGCQPTMDGDDRGPGAERVAHDPRQWANFLTDLKKPPTVFEDIHSLPRRVAVRRRINGDSPKSGLD